MYALQGEVLKNTHITHVYIQYLGSAETLTAILYGIPK